MERNLGDWDEIYRNARKSEKLKFEANERDEGELERTGQPVCIYEIYSGAGSWPFLHHGSLYRGLSLVSSFYVYCNFFWSKFLSFPSPVMQFLLGGL
jgi:hypothetical protein